MEGVLSWVVTIHWGAAAATGLAAFLYAAVVVPLWGRYKEWKHDPSRIRMYRADMFGRWVPDLWLSRLERGAKSLALSLFALGAYSLYYMMEVRPLTRVEGGQVASILYVPPPQKGR